MQLTSIKNVYIYIIISIIKLPIYALKITEKIKKSIPEIMKLETSILILIYHNTNPS